MIALSIKNEKKNHRPSVQRLHLRISHHCPRTSAWRYWQLAVYVVDLHPLARGLKTALECAIFHQSLQNLLPEKLFHSAMQPWGQEQFWMCF